MTLQDFKEKGIVNYQEAVALLAEHTKNRSLVNGLQRKDNAFNREKLAYELGKISGEQLFEAVKTENIQESTQVEPEPEPEQEGANVDSEEFKSQKIDLLNETLRVLFNQRREKSNQLADCETDEQRKELVDEIEALQAKYNEVYLEVKALETGEVPSEPTARQTKEVSDEVLILNAKIAPLQQKLSRLKLNLSRPSSAFKTKKWQEEMRQTELELQEIKDRKKLLNA